MAVVFEQFAEEQSYKLVTTGHYFDPVGSQKIVSKQFESIFCKAVERDYYAMLCCGATGTKAQVVI